MKTWPLSEIEKKSISFRFPVWAVDFTNVWSIQYCIVGKGSKNMDEMNLTISPIIKVYDCSKNTI